MTEENAYEMLQRWLDLAEQLKNSGFYYAEELVDELRNRIGD